MSIAGSTLNTFNSLGMAVLHRTHPSTGNSGNINITSGGAISIQGTALNSQTQTTGNGGNITLTGSGTQGPTDGILITGGTIETGSAAAPGIVQGNAGNVILSGPSVLLSGASIDTSTIGAGLQGQRVDHSHGHGRSWRDAGRNGRRIALDRRDDHCGDLAPCTT